MSGVQLALHLLVQIQQAAEALAAQLPKEKKGKVSLQQRLVMHVQSCGNQNHADQGGSTPWLQAGG